ncbi:MAG: YebC/PmpR family DNA-binding transcriptional regulator [Fibromonadaceae bacterium]|jgi:YebC/PmpR family DNA-binding regulatory protein|nr:YebC/PmpR family DNA-binding transcriptional regulator [Fibromonadaceae bacterium]
MAGHSKWANIKRKKAKTDVGRATAWNKLIKEITVAAKLGGGNPDGNPRLRVAILKAKGQSLPSKNIESAIAKGVGGTSGANMEEPMYEGYGPSGCAVLVQCLTDNRTRSVADVRNIFNKNGGNMGEQGSVSWSFKKKGIVIVDAAAYPEDKVMDLVLDAGADDMATEDGVHEIESTPENFEAVTKALENANIEMLSAELTYMPETTVKLEGEDAQKMLKMIEKLEDNEDVQDVYHNAELEEQ